MPGSVLQTKDSLGSGKAAVGEILETAIEQMIGREMRHRRLVAEKIRDARPAGIPAETAAKSDHRKPGARHRGSHARVVEIRQDSVAMPGISNRVVSDS